MVHRNFERTEELVNNLLEMDARLGQLEDMLYEDTRDILGPATNLLAMHYLINHLPTAWALTVIHLRLSLVPVLAGLAIALPWGVLAWRTTALRRLTTVAASAVFTIPSLALFVVLPLVIPTRILDEANVIVALTLDRKSTRLNSSHESTSRMPSSA